MNISKNRSLIASIVATLVLSACGQHPSDSISSKQHPVGNDSRALHVAGPGTIVFNEVEGGHFVIWADDGETYLPLQLAEEYQVDGLRVEFEGRIAIDSYTTRLSGRLLNVEGISTLDAQ